MKEQIFYAMQKILDDDKVSLIDLFNYFDASTLEDFLLFLEDERTDCK